MRTPTNTNFLMLLRTIPSLKSLIYFVFKVDLVSIQDRVEKKDLFETSAQERAIPKGRYALNTNVTIFCALLNKIPMGCLDAVIPEQL